jgi:methionyl-tRNA formyltransferase
VPPLRALVHAGHEVALVVTRPDKRRRRKGDPEPSPVKAAALALGLAVSEDPDDLVGVGAELGVVVAYGRIIRPHVLEALPMVNLHFSLLPRWRGAAPVERAILAGDEVTGVCVMEVVDELDAGAVYSRAEVPIGPADTLDSLRSTLVDEGTRLLVQSLEAGLGEPEPQQGEVVYAEKLTADDLRLAWSRPAAELDRVVRVGGAWTNFRDKRLKVHAARPLPDLIEGASPGSLGDGDGDGVVVATGEGRLDLLEVQPEGKARQSAKDWANGARPASGEVLE